MANAPAVLEGYLALYGALGTGTLDPQIRKLIALLSGQSNHCDHCLSDQGRRIYLTYQLLTANVSDMKEGKSSIAEPAEQKRPVPSRQQQAAVSILRTTAYLRRLGSRVFEQHGITSQQYNVLRILRGAGTEGLPTLDIAERMIEHTPGITRLLDRLEGKKLVRRERPSDDRRQVLCYATKAGLDLLSELDAPMKNQANAALRMLNDSELDELIRLLERVRGQN
jgi:DNA-binding MarR family transcriptional regulator